MGANGKKTKTSQNVGIVIERRTYFMNKRVMDFTAGALTAALLTGGIAYAKSGSEMVEIAYSNIKIFLDGEQLQPKDANGQSVEPFIYNGTTYLPVRAVGQAFGKEVNWDGVEKVVYLGAKPGNVENWLDVCGPYQYSQHGKEYRLSDNKYFTMSGQKYTNGFVLENYYGEQEALFNLNGKYDSVSFTVGHIDGSQSYNSTLNVYLDGIIAYTKELKYDDVAQKVTVPLKKALQMKIEITGKDNPHWGFSEGQFE